MTTASTKYLGELRCENIHLQSNTLIHTDAPTDNMGKGAAFSPTDLCALSLPTCIITTMAIYCNQHGLNSFSASANTTKIMDNYPRRIIEIKVELSLELNEQDNNEKNKTAIENIVKACPVSRSLHPDIFQNVSILWK